ncbi:glycosyltransferase family 25 protein [Tabrizicola sp. BL-A-41-H6]|uniref:glycosyltransferase family 25 protein n=1 Tax=Tabrizicola sp. BL-A-41-H6 TaxID=3421107 RepID=UPI003D67C04C
MPLARKDLRTWLINLPRAVERRRKMEAQLSHLPFQHKVFDGIDGKAREAELIQTVDVEAFERNMGRNILIGGIGCYHSHLAVWREFLATGAPVALILEDDVVFHDDFVSAVDAALAASDRWDMLKLNKIRAKLPVSQGKIGTYTLNAYVGPATGTGAYLIKRETVEKLLPRMLPITRATDHEINRFFLHDFRLFGLEPFPSHVDDGNISFITGVASGDLKKFKWYKRLPSYCLRAANYWRRLKYLIRIGAFPGPKKTHD